MEQQTERVINFIAVLKKCKINFLRMCETFLLRKIQTQMSKNVNKFQISTDKISNNSSCYAEYIQQTQFEK